MKVTQIHRKSEATQCINPALAQVDLSRATELIDELVKRPDVSCKQLIKWLSVILVGSYSFVFYVCLKAPHKVSPKFVKVLATEKDGLFNICLCLFCVYELFASEPLADHPAQEGEA